MTSSLTIRQRMILGILNTKKGFTEGSYLASQLGVTDRTIRSDIQAMIPLIRDYGAEITSIRGKGYLIRTEQPELLQQLTYREDTYMSSEERIRDIALYLIECDDPIPVSELEDELFVSRSTLDADLRLIAQKYSSEMPHIILIRTRQTVRFEADERKKRYLMNRLLTDNWNYNYEAGMHIPGLPIPMDEFRSIEQILLRFFRNHAIRLSEQDHIKFLFSLVIAVSRIRGGHDIPERRRSAEDVLKQDGFIAEGIIPEAESGIFEGSDEASQEGILIHTERLAGEIGAAVRVPFSKNEIQALADELAHRMLFNEKFLTKRYWKEHHRNEFAGIIRTVLKETDSGNGLFLSSNDMLKSELLFALMNCYYNPYYKGMRHTEVIRSLKDSNPAAVAVAREFAAPVREKFGMELMEETIMEMAANIAVALENASDDALSGGVKAALLSHVHISSSRYLLTKMRSFFGTRLDLSGPYSIYEYEWMEKGAFDFVISTTKLRKDDKRPPVLVISPLLTKLDLENINYYLEERKTAAIFAGSRCALGALCLPEYHQVHGKISGEGDLLWEMVNILKNQEILKCDDEHALTTMRESVNCFAFSEGFLIGVLKDSNVVRELIAGMRLEKPVIIDEVPVKTAYTLALKADSETAPLFALEHLAHLFRRVYQERSPEQARYKDNLKKTVEMLELQ